MPWQVCRAAKGTVRRHPPDPTRKDDRCVRQCGHVVRSCSFPTGACVERTSARECGRGRACARARAWRAPACVPAARGGGRAPPLPSLRRPRAGARARAPRARRLALFPRAASLTFLPRGTAGRAGRGDRVGASSKLGSADRARYVLHVALVRQGGQQCHRVKALSCHHWARPQPPARRVPTASPPVARAPSVAAPTLTQVLVWFFCLLARAGGTRRRCRAALDP